MATIKEKMFYYYVYYG